MGHHQYDHAFDLLGKHCMKCYSTVLVNFSEIVLTDQITFVQQVFYCFGVCNVLKL